LGLLCLGVGVFVTLPVSFAALMYAYEDIINPSQPPPIPPATSAAPGTTTSTRPGFGALPAGVSSWLTLLLAGAVTILLLVIAAIVGLSGNVIGYALALGVVGLALAIILHVRRAGLPGGFLAVFLPVFLLVVGLTVLITSILPVSYVSTARIKLMPNASETTLTSTSSVPSRTYDPYLIQTECEILQSEEVLGPVIKALDLDQKWGYRFGGSEALRSAEVMTTLKSRIHVQPLRNASLIAISVYGNPPEEAANIANQIVESYKNRDNLGPVQVEIVDRALPALSPIRPNKPLNLAIGVLVGLVLGTAAGGARVGFRLK